MKPSGSSSDRPSHPLSVLNDAGDGASSARPLAGAMTVRPYQLLCTICSLGGPLPEDVRRGKVQQIKDALKANPDQPLNIVCNAGDLFDYQDPGLAEDTPEGADFNRKRDLDILQKLNWTPGITLPARVAFMSIFSVQRRPQPIPSARGICGYGSRDPGWEGCPKADSGDYEKGLKMGIGALTPKRSEEEMVRAKEATLASMNAAAEVRMRPHLLLCAVCQYAGGTRPPFKPDNLPEFLQMVLQEKPDVNIRLVRQADVMMCGPCPQRVPGKNACTNIAGSGGLSNEKRDLDVLQHLGLHFGDVMKARDLYRLIFQRIHSSMSTCAREGSGPTSAWWDRGCGDPNPETRHKLYETGREQLQDRFA